MGLFERLERALERLIEGKLMGRFRGRVHPIEIARRVAQQMQAERRIGVDRTYVPNAFVVALNPLDFEPLAPIEREVEKELIGYLGRQVAEREYTPAGPFRVLLESDAGVASGHVEVRANFERADDNSGGNAPLPAVPLPPPTLTATPPGTRAVLLGKAGFVQGKVIPLKADVLLIGRSPDCDISIGDGQVSKSHARLDWNGTTYLLSSGGRNGTRVNGLPIGAPHALENGDDIGVGASTLHFRLLHAPAM